MGLTKQNVYCLHIYTVNVILIVRNCHRIAIVADFFKLIKATRYNNFKPLSPNNFKMLPCNVKMLHLRIFSVKQFLGVEFSLFVRKKHYFHVPHMKND